MEPQKSPVSRRENNLSGLDDIFFEFQELRFAGPYPLMNVAGKSACSAWVHLHIWKKCSVSAMSSSECSGFLPLKPSQQGL